MTRLDVRGFCYHAKKVTPEGGSGLWQNLVCHGISYALPRYRSAGSFVERLIGGYMVMANPLGREMLSHEGEQLLAEKIYSVDKLDEFRIRSEEFLYRISMVIGTLQLSFAKIQKRI